MNLSLGFGEAFHATRPVPFKVSRRAGDNKKEL